MRRSALRRVTPLRTTKLISTRRRVTGPAQWVRELVWQRAGGCCERCVLDLCDPLNLCAYEIHHRRPRSMGGTQRLATNAAPNLVLLCSACHREVERRRELARAQGWLVSQAEEPGSVPLLYGGLRWVLLTAEGMVDAP